jgi:hypothetical protein
MQGPGGVDIRQALQNRALWACGVGAQESGDPSGLWCGGLVERWPGGPVERQPCGPVGCGLEEQRLGGGLASLLAGGVAEWRTSGPTPSWGPGGPRDSEPGGAEQWLHGPLWWGLGGPAVLSVNCALEKPSTSLRFRVPYFLLSLVLCLSQVCLQHVSKIPDSQSSCSLQLCPSRYLQEKFLCVASAEFMPY